MAKRKRAKSRVYRDAERLLDEVLSATENFPRQCKYTVGERLQGLCIDQLLSISEAYEAHGSERKAAALDAAAHTHEVLRTLLRVASERRWVGLGRFAQIAELADGIDAQLSAWRASVGKSAECDADAQPERGGQG